MSNSAAFETLQQAIDGLNSLADGASKELPTEVAKALDTEVRKTIAAGTDPDGKPWQPTRDGQQPLKGAASTLRTTAMGKRVVQSISGHHALHHLGRAAGGIQRAIIPMRAVPKAALVAFQRVYNDFVRSKL